MILDPAYQAALDYIFHYVDYERRRNVPYTEAAWDLQRMRQVLQALGTPHLGLRFVHVAGSKGKGSTAANIEAVLRAAGIRTGFYTSPHLHTFRERIRVDGALISQADVVRLLEQCKPAVEAVPGITTFEIITALALLYFAEQGVEWVVLEVGLGGRLDATNVVTPAVSVITPISLEHTALLGNTLAAIAREKAGIIKPGVPVVVAPQAGEALLAIEQAAALQSARLTQVGRDWLWRPVADGLEGQVFDLDCLPGSRPRRWPAAWGVGPLAGLRIPLLGSHQLSNAATAVAACAELAMQGVELPVDALRRGLSSVVWPARLEVLPAVDGRERPVVLDSAHTDTSAQLLRAALARYFPGRSLHLIVGVSNDKDAAKILASLLPGAETVTLTRSRHPRAADPQALAGLAAQFVPAGRVHVAASVRQALAQALSSPSAGDVICLAGSLFVAAEGRAEWLALHPGALPADDWAYQAELPELAAMPSPLPAGEEVRR